jgi:protein SCO1/2
MSKSIICLRRCEAGARPIASWRAAALVAVGLLLAALGGCDSGSKWHSTNLTGAFPALTFTMTRAADGKQVTAADYRGQVVMVYFGYTFCPDVCPTTLANVAEMLKRMGPDAQHVRVLFVTVDPKRDTPDILRAYVKNFAPQVVGLRGTPDQLASMARRYRVAYSTTSAKDGQPYEVTHSSAIYVFDGSGAARLLVSSLSTAQPDIAGAAADLKRLVEDANPPSLIDRLLRLV